MKLVYNGWFGYIYIVDLLFFIFVFSYVLIIFSFFFINYKVNFEKIWFDVFVGKENINCYNYDFYVLKV